MTCVKCKSTIPDDSIFCNHCGKKLTNKKPRNTKKRGNGQGSVYKRGSSWTALKILYWYVDEHGKRKRKTVSKSGFKTKLDAINYLPQLRLPTSTKGQQRLCDYWETWKENAMVGLSNSKQTAYKIAYKKIQSISHVPIGNLKISDLQSVVDEQAKTYYPAKDMKVLLSHLYKMAAAEEEVKTNLAEFIKLPDLDEKESKPFSTEDQKRLWKLYENGDNFVPYILLMIYTGMMPGELLSAKKSMIDWEKQTIVGAGKKTKKRKVTPIVFADIAVPILSRICELSQGEKLIHANKDNFYSMYYEALARAGCEKLPPYACRHTTGTALGTSDIPLAVVKEIMRHSKITTTQRYVHVDAKTMLDAVNRVNETQ